MQNPVADDSSCLGLKIINLLLEDEAVEKTSQPRKGSRVGPDTVSFACLPVKSTGSVVLLLLLLLLLCCCYYNMRSSPPLLYIEYSDSRV